MSETCEARYFVRYFCPIRNKTLTTKWRMSEADATKRYAGQTYEILWTTKVDQFLGAPAESMSMARFNPGLDLEKK